MEIKEWSQYSMEEKKRLLNHWWYYYGKDIYTLKELEDFNKLIETKDNSVLNVALVGFLRGDANKLLLFSMRQNQVDEMLSLADEILVSNNNLNYSKETYMSIYYTFMGEVVRTYNSPEPAVPINEEEIVKQILSL